jgi:hypothetical protein
MVVAGQFPMSFEGSICLVECLYEGLLWGTDPRRLLFDLRRNLYARFPDRHDWSSLTAYISLPADFDSQLGKVRIERAMENINAAMNHADEVTRRAFLKLVNTQQEQVKGEPLGPGEEVSAQQKVDGEKVPSRDEKFSPENESLLDDALKRIIATKRRLEHLLTSIPRERSRIHGYLASTSKRQAEVLYSAARSEVFKVEVKAIERSYDLLRESRDHYWNSFLADHSSSWAVVQFISLTLVMHHSEQFPDLRFYPFPEAARELVNLEPSESDMEKDLDALWSLAHLLSLYDLRGEDKTRQIWAHANLIELYLLDQVMSAEGGRPGSSYGRRALEHTVALMELAGRDSFEVYSTRRQIFRYVQWFNEIAPSMDTLIDLAENIFAKFPKDIEGKWK